MMVCQKCQVAAATVHTTTIVNGKATETHFCDKCTDKDHRGIPGMPTNAQDLIKQILAPLLAPMQGLSPLLNIPNIPAAKSPPDKRIQACPTCGITLRDIQKTGRLGCPNDYSVFGDTLSQMIATAQNGCTQHIGKVPKKGAPLETRRAILQAMVDSLQHRIEGAVFREDYEEAAECRDRINNARAELHPPDGNAPPPNPTP